MRAMSAMRRYAAATVVVLTTACVPYSLGTTAQTLPKGSSTLSFTYSVAQGASNRIEALREGTRERPDVMSFDSEMRFGLSERSDVALRIVNAGGLSSTYKRRLAGSADLDEPAVAMLLGGGVLYWGDYLHAEAALIASGRDGGWGLPFGAIRTLATVPTRGTLDWDEPIVGAHVGWRWRPHWRLGFSLLPELAMYYDDAREAGRSNWVMVPSLTVTLGPRAARTRFPPRPPRF
jgi:hypothetical protein